MSAPTTLDPAAHAIFGEGVLIFFLALFALVLVYTFRRRNRSRFEHAARLPLDDSDTLTLKDDPKECGHGRSH